MRTLVCLLALTSVAAAKEFTVSDADQEQVQAICDVAAASPGLNRNARAQIATWCVMWERRVQDAVRRVDPPEDKNK